MTNKTLKDLEKEMQYKVYDGFKIMERIREEAIKRVKYWMDFKQEEGMLVNWMQIQGRIAELKEFANISGDDLK